MKSRFAILLLASVIPLALAMAAFLGLSLQQEGTRLRTQVMFQTEEMAQALEREFAAQIDLLRVLAQSPYLDATTKDLSAFRTLALRYKAVLPLWFRIILSDAHSRAMLVNTGVPLGTPLGQVVDWASQEIAVQQQRSVVGNLVGPGPTSDGRARASIRVPVLRDGTVPYVLTATIAMDGFAALLHPRDMPADYKAFLVDRAGTVAVDPRDSRKIGQKADSAALLARARSEGGFYLSAEEDAAGFQAIGLTGWSVHLAIPKRTFNAPLVRAEWLLAGIGLSALALSAVFIWLLRREFHDFERLQVRQEQTARMASLGRITGGVAHDFNNLLLVVSGTAELLRKRAPAELKRYIDTIKEASERGAQITRTLLAFSRPATHKSEVIDVSARVRQLLPILRQGAGEAVQLEARLAEGLAACADPVQLEMALLNLVANARDAMAAGGRIRIEVARALLPGKAGQDAVLIQVTDEGPGIPQDILPQVFEPFFTTKAVGQGTGLGLSQVYGFARAAQGTVQIGNAEPAGTVVSIYLPASRGLETSAPEEEPALARRAKGGQVLVVDDNAEVRALAGEFLGGEGWDVAFASDAQTALTALEARPFEVVVTDIVMPGGENGLALARAIRERWPETAVILISGFSESIEEAILDRFTVLRKPFTQQKLADMAAAARQQSEAAGPSQHAADAKP